MSMANEDLETPHPVLEILLHTDKTARTFTIQVLTFLYLCLEGIKRYNLLRILGLE